MEEYTKIILEELVNAIQKEIRLDIINNNRNKLWDL